MGTIATMNVKLAMDSSDLERGIAGAQSKIESMSAKFKAAGAAMSLGVTAPLMGIAGAALKSAGEFESNMNVMQSVTGAVAADMALMEQQALDLGATTAFSAGEASAGMLELGKAGLKPLQIMEAMPGVLSLAAAGNMDVASAATIAANAVNTFGLEASATTDVANMLAAAANASSADVNDMAQGFQMAGAVFAAMNQDMSDLTTGIALMSNAGINGSDAGTSLKTMMMRLAAPTKEASGAMQELGLQVYNADGSMKSFENIVGQLEKATKGLTDEQRNMAFSTIFGADAIRAAVVMTENGAAGFAEMEKAVNAAGAAEEAAAARMKGITGAVEYMKGSIDSFLIGAAMPYLNMLGSWVRGAGDAVTAFGSLPRPIMDMAVAFAAVLAAAGPVMLAVSGIGAVLAFLASPIALVIAAVGALAAAFATDFMGIRTVAMRVAKGLANLWDAMVWIFEGKADNIDWWYDIAEAFGLSGEMAMAAGSAMFDMGIAVQGVIDAFRNFGRYIAFIVEDGDYLNDWLTNLPAAVQPAALAFGQFLANLRASGLSMLSALRPVFAELQKWINLAMKGDFSGLQTEIGNALNSVKVAVSEFKWSDFITPLTDWAVYIAKLAWDTVVTTLTNWGAWISSLDWGGFITTLSDWGAYIQGTVLNWADYITKLDWGGYITAVLDWGTYITATLTDWGTYIISLDWGTFVTPLADWGVYITATLSDWGTYVSKLDWGAFVTAWLDWSSKIRELGWSTFVTSVSWGTYIGSLVWDNYLSKIDWAGIITKLTDWGTYISNIAWSDYITPLWADYIKPIVWDNFLVKIDWANVGLTALDWAMWIPALVWDVVIMPVRWAAWIGALVWNTVINPVKWSEFIAGITNWDNWIKLLQWSVVLTPVFWGSYIASIDWDKYLPVKFAWNSFISKVNWLERIPVFSWPTFDEFKWADFVSALEWPTISAPSWSDFVAKLSWPTIRAPKWDDFIPDLSWPTIPSFPGWAQILQALGWGGGEENAEPKATGGPVTAGTPYIVGERGQELFVPNVNGRIIPNDELGGWYADAMGGSGGGAAVQIATVNVLNELDIREVAYQVAGYLQRRR